MDPARTQLGLLLMEQAQSQEAKNTQRSPMRVIPLGIHYEHPIIFSIKGEWDIFPFAVFGTGSQEGV